MGHLLVVMGVSGCGKSTIGRTLAQALAAPFLEGDDFHPAANIDKMRSGTPLSDDDRAAWLDAVLLSVDRSQAPVLILSCSALTPYVQQRLLNASTRQVSWLHLKAPFDVIRARLQNRKSHFMTERLLESQFSALSPPDGVITIDAQQPVSACVDAALRRLESHIFKG